MLEIFQKTVKELPAKLNILSAKERNSKYVIRLEYGGKETTVDLKKTCAPGEERDYCWSVAATAISTIYFYSGEYKMARLWMDAMITHNKSIVEPENA